MSLDNELAAYLGNEGEAGKSRELKIRAGESKSELKIGDKEICYLLVQYLCRGKIWTNVNESLIGR